MSNPNKPSFVPDPHRDLAWKIAPDLLTSFRYAWAGLVYTFLTQRNFRIHVVAGTIGMIVAIALGLDAVSLAILTLLVALVWTMELLNTALESVVDLTVGKTYHDLAKIAKDCGAGAVLVSAIAAIVIGCLLVAPTLVARVFPHGV